MANQPVDRIARRIHEIQLSLWDEIDWQDEHYNEIADAAARCFEREFGLRRRNRRQASGASEDKS